MRNNADPKEIWLEPLADKYGEEGRLWCEDNVWDEDETGPAVMYIRSDLVALRRDQ